MYRRIALLHMHGGLSDADVAAFNSLLTGATFFASTAILILGGLVAMLGTTDRVEWRRNRSLIVLFGGVLVTMTVIAVPAAFLLGYPISLAVVGIVGPVLVLLRPVIDLAVAALLILISPLQILFQFLQSLIHPRPNVPSPVAGGFGQQLGPPVPGDQDPGGDWAIVIPKR